MEKPHILICDDEEGVRESLRVMLAKEYTLAFAENGEEAVRYVEEHTPELVIMDVKMPKMDGLEALGRIKQAKLHVCVLVITGYESSEIAAQAMRLGADDYLTKPFKRQVVLEKVREIFRHRRGE